MSDAKKMLAALVEELSRLGVGEYSFTTATEGDVEVSVRVRVSKRTSRADASRHIEAVLGWLKMVSAWPTCQMQVPGRRRPVLAMRDCSHDFTHTVVTATTFRLMCDQHAEKRRSDRDVVAVVELPRLRLAAIKAEMKSERRSK